ncbi:MAG: type II secretion system protein [Patescibacteria group bacterium]
MDVFRNNERIRPREAGMSVLEVLLAIAIFGVLAASLMTMVWGSLVISGGAVERIRATLLAEEGLDAARSIRNIAWTELADGDHGLDKTGGLWQFAGASDSTDGLYVRSVNVEAVNRDVNGDIVAVGGTLDPRTKKITSTVTWNSPYDGAKSLALVTHLTNWNVYDWNQTTDNEFSAGEFDYTVVVGSGEAAYLLLDTGTVTVGTYLSPIFDSGSEDTSYRTIYWHSTLPAGTTATVATRSGNIDMPDGSWSSWSAELSDGTGSPIVSPDARYIQYRVTLQTADINFVPQFEDITVTYTQ